TQDQQIRLTPTEPSDPKPRPPPGHQHGRAVAMPFHAITEHLRPSRLDTTTLVKPAATPRHVHAAWITTRRRSLVGSVSPVGSVVRWG
ncbi:MAG: hypothetical protein ACRDRO_12145, partial [Pseudonocardiaceae bacterium]